MTASNNSIPSVAGRHPHIACTTTPPAHANSAFLRTESAARDIGTPPNGTDRAARSRICQIACHGRALLCKRCRTQGALSRSIRQRECRSRPSRDSPHESGAQTCGGSWSSGSFGDRAILMDFRLTWQGFPARVVYDLSRVGGCPAVQVIEVVEGLLVRGHIGGHAACFRAAAGGGVEEHGFPDPGQGVKQRADG